jgi:hypothetical protein
MGTKKGFFDNITQREKIFRMCKRNGLDYSNPEIRWYLREYYRIQDGYYDRGSPWFQKKFGWSGLGEPPDWVKNDLPPPEGVVLDSTLPDAPTVEQISRVTLPINSDKFWDSKQQKDRVSFYVKKYHPTEYDTSNENDMAKLRELDRIKYGFYGSGADGFGLPRNLSPNQISIAKRLRDLQKQAQASNKASSQDQNPQNPLVEAMPRGMNKNKPPKLRSDPNRGPAAVLDAIKQNYGRMKNTEKIAEVEPEHPAMKDLVPWGNLDGEDGTFGTWYEKYINPEFAKPWKKENPLGKIHHQWSEDIESDDFVIHLDPRDHLKTTFISIGYAIFCLCERLHYPVLIICLSDKNVINIWSSIKRHLSENPRILERYGYIIDDERPNSQEIGFFTLYQEKGIKDAACFCTTWNAKEVMGTHPNLIMCDDIQDRPLPPSQMEVAVQLLDANLLPALGTTGKMIVVGTIKGNSAENDIYLYLISKDLYSAYEYPAVYEVDRAGNPVYEGTDFNGKPKMKAICPDLKDVRWEKKDVPRIDPRTGNMVMNKATGRVKTKKEIIIYEIIDRWKYQSIYPEVYSVEEIVKKRILLNDPRAKGAGDGRFWSEYFLRPYNPAGVYFPRDRIGAFAGKDCPYQSIGGLLEALQKANSGCYLCVDPGGRGKHGIAISVFANLDGKFYVMQVVVVKAGILAAAKEIADLLVIYNVISWGIEGNFLQAETFGEPLDAAVNDELKSRGFPRYASPVVFKTTGDKVLRISEQIGSLIGPAGGGSIKFFVNMNATDYAQLDQEITQFPTVQSQEAITHEFDLLDSIACGVVHVMQAKFELIWESGYASNPLSPREDIY